MKDYRSIRVTKLGKTLQIDNPTKFQLIGSGSQGAVFKLSDDKCVKIYHDPQQARMEAEAYKAGRNLSFFPKIYRTGSNYIVMEYFNAPTLAQYLRNSTYIPESIVRKLLYILKEMKNANFTMVDAPLRHIFVLENEELKLVDHVNAFKRVHPVPLKLLRELKMMLLKDSFLAQVKKLEPETLAEWDQYFSENQLDYRNIPVSSGGNGEGVKVESTMKQHLIGSGHQGAVFRVSEDQCVKIYGKTEHAKQEQRVLLDHQDLSFMPKVYETGSNYVLMEYLQGPDLNTFLKKQSSLSEEVTRRLLEILTTMKAAGFKQIDAPLRHIIVTNKGFKLVDHVYSYTKAVPRPLEMFQNLHERQFLDTFLEQVKVMDPGTYKEWTKSKIPLDSGASAGSDKKKRKKGHDHKKEHKRDHHKKEHDHKKGHDHKNGRNKDRRK